MRVIILDLETIPDPELHFEPPEDRPDAFPPPPFHQIVAFGAMLWDRNGPKGLGCLGELGDERSALEAFVKLVDYETTLVTWNGRGFDLPVIVARCLKHRVSFTTYYLGRGFRYRFSDEGHLDLKDQLADYEYRTAGLDTWAKMVGLPGKGDVDGSQVAELWAAGEHERIRSYCLDDVAQTARLWLEWRHLTGSLVTETLEREVERLDAFVAEKAGGES